MSSLHDTLCAQCAKNASIALCFGCQQSFCTRHFIKHRLYLAQQMDDLHAKCLTLQDNLKRSHLDESLLLTIDTWEQNSIRKIQQLAEAARDDVQRSFEKFKESATISLNKIDSEFQSTADADNYTEIDINTWTEQLSKVQNLVEQPLNVSVIEDRKRSVVRGIKVVEQERAPSIASLTSTENGSSVSLTSFNTKQEYFVHEFGPCEISENNTVAYQSSYSGGLSQITGSNRYSCGKHSISFLIENKGKKNLFFGIHSASSQINSSVLTRSIYGWWNFDHVILKGETGGNHHPEKFQKGDILTLTLDCDNKRIQCHHDRTQLDLNLSIDLKECPFPWQILVKLLTEGDCVRIVR